MRIIARKTLHRYIETDVAQQDRPALRRAVEAWLAEAERAQWSHSADLKNQYASASIVNRERVVFNLKGNDYRLITAINYERRIIFIKWIGTHAEYDKIDASSVRYQPGTNSTDPH